MPINPDYYGDPSYLMEDAGWIPAEWQRRVLRSTHKRTAICCARQMGKSLVVACKAVHRAITRPRQNIYLSSRSQDQADELFAKIKDVYDRIGRPVRIVRELVSEIQLGNRSRVVAFPCSPDTVRGYADCSLLILDEVSRIPGAMISALMPMVLASNGDILMLSSPCGCTGYFYDEWSNPHAKWERIRATADECPHFDKEMLTEIRRQLGPTMARQELDAEFLRDSQSVFSVDSIDCAFQSNVPAIHDF